MTNHPNRSRWTYARNYAAWLLYADGRQAVVTVPDQVAEDQHGYDESGQTFPVRISGRASVQYPDGRIGIDRNGRMVRARVDGSEYDLHGHGTGEMVVRPAKSV